jgi:ribosomal protein S12 methylthiotransferase
MSEAERLVKAGVKELLVISQDTSAYGLDIKYAESTWNKQPLKARFFELSQALGSLGVWVRMHYVYPYPHVDDVIPLMAEGKILPYLDIPFQHASPKVLKAMRRPASQDKVLDRIAKWRKICPDLALRSTFIVGFPGETDDDFRMLIDFLQEARLTRVGCFKYEDVPGAKANDLPNLVPEEVKEERWEMLMGVQRAISSHVLASRIGKTIDVLVDDVDEEGAIARSAWDAPEVDGCVFLNGATGVKIGDKLRVKIGHADEYDLWGEVE